MNIIVSFIIFVYYEINSSGFDQLSRDFISKHCASVANKN